METLSKGDSGSLEGVIPSPRPGKSRNWCRGGLVAVFDRRQQDPPYGPCSTTYSRSTRGLAFYPVLVAGTFFLECFEVAVFSDMIDPLLDRGVWG
jgi:hypothetical protein